MFILCIAFSVLVLATSFPIAEMFRQHNDIAAARTELNRLNAGNQSLQREATDLAEPSNIESLAHRDYDMIRSGEQAYTVLPSSTSSGPDGASAGLNQGAVTPGSPESQALTGVSPDNSSGLPTAAVTNAGAPSSSSPGSGQGLWNRVLYTLEFWR